MRRPVPTVDSSTLTHEDLRLLALLAQGLPVSAVAGRLYLSERSVRRRVRLICDRIGVQTPVQAIVWAVKRGLV